MVRVYRGLGCRAGRAMLVVAVLAASLLAGFSSTNAFVWQREALSQGEWWRLLSAHLVHLSAQHLLLNLLGLWLVMELLCETLSTAAWTSLLLVSALGTSVLLLLLQPQLHWYAGLSGVLHGLWAGGAAFRWIDERKNRFLLILLALFARLIIGGQVGSEFTVIAEAHWYGAFCGLFWFVLTRLHERLADFD